MYGFRIIFVKEMLGKSFTSKEHYTFFKLYDYNYDHEDYNLFMSITDDEILIVTIIC